MKTLFSITLNFAISFSIAFSVPANSAETTPRVPYTVPCGNILQALEAGQLEEEILSTPRSEAELVQILKDHYILQSSLFLRTFMSMNAETLFAFDLKNIYNADLETYARIIQTILKYIKTEITDAHIENFLKHMETVASQISTDDSKNRMFHLIVSRTLNAIRKSESNKNEIYNILKKSLYHAALSTLPSILRRHEALYNSYSAHAKDDTTGIGVASAVLSMIYLGTVFASISHSSYMWLPASILLAPWIFYIKRFKKDVFLSQRSEKKEIQNMLKILNEESDQPQEANKNNSYFVFEQIRYVYFNSASTELEQMLKLMESEEDLMNLTLNKKTDIAQMTLTQAAYLGHGDILALNERYTRLNGLFQNDVLSQNLSNIRQKAQEILSSDNTRNRYEQQLEFSVSVRESVTEIHNHLESQKRELESLFKNIQKIEEALKQLKAAPYNSNVTRNDIQKGVLIMSRFEAELKRLEQQAIQMDTIQKKIAQMVELQKQLTHISNQLPNTQLGWEEAAKTILLKIDEILSGSST